MSVERCMKQVVFLVTGLCNFSCHYCVYDCSRHIDMAKRKKDELSGEKLSLIFKGSDLLKKAEVISIAGGEPFIKDDLSVFIKTLNDYHKKVSITTNGYFTDNIRRLLEKMDEPEKYFTIAVSIDGFEETQDKIAGVNGAYKQAWATLKVLEEYGIPHFVNTVVTNENMDEVFEFNEYLTAEEVNHCLIPLANSLDEERVFYSEEQTDRLLNHYWTKHNKKYLLSKGKYRITNCHAGIYGAMVDYNGDVYPCTTASAYTEKHLLGLRRHKGFLLGTLKEQTFDTIMYSDRTEKVIEKKVKKCEGCYSQCEVDREERCSHDFGEDISIDDMRGFIQFLPNAMSASNKFFDSSNFYNVEEYGGRKFCWMKGKKAKIFTKVSDKFSKKHLLRLDFLNFIGENEIRIKIAINESKIIFDNFLEGSVNIQRLEVAFELEDSIDLAEIQIVLNKMWQPGASDTRMLGIGFVQAEII